MSRAAVAFPGRGSYGPGSLHSFPAGHPWVRRADELRAGTGLPSLRELDAADRFAPELHLRPSNAWPLTFLASLLDAERIAGDHEVVAVVASSTGWYTALAASGAIEFDDALRIVAELAAAAEEALPDGTRAAELVYPMSDDGWQVVAEREAAIDAVVEASEGSVTRSVVLGSHTILGGPAGAIDTAAAALPPIDVGGRAFPLRIPGDGWHTPLRAESVARAAERIGSVPSERPNVTLVDGSGTRHTPFSTDPAALVAAAILDAPTVTYDFARSLRVALREYAPDVVLLPGPGSSLGAACAQTIVTDGYRGLRSREEFETAQGVGNPILFSMRR